MPSLAALALTPRVIAPTREAISRADDQFTDTDRALWVSLLTASERYIKTSSAYPNIELALNDVTPETLRAKQLNATMDCIEQLGAHHTRMNADGVTQSDSDDREAYLSYALSVLYGSSAVSGSENIGGSFHVVNIPVW